MTRKRKKRSFAAHWLFRLAVAATVWVAISTSIILPLRWFNPITTSFMLRDDSGRQPLLHEWSGWAELGVAPALAVVASEDQKFAQHFGIDFDSIADSIEVADEGGRLRGASTITQQTAKNLYLWSGRSLVRKGIEAYLAILLEICLPKKRILEIYLNIVEFGPGIYGTTAASKYFFHKPAMAMTDAEAALLAAVLPNPVNLRVDKPTAYVRERQLWILQQMQRLRREGWITQLSDNT